MAGAAALIAARRGPDTGHSRGNASLTPLIPKGCDPGRASPSVDDYEFGLACAPIRALGYAPIKMETPWGVRYGDPHGDCSGPTQNEVVELCLAHDYARDLVRVGAVPQKEGNEASDDRFLEDYETYCGQQTWERYFCTVRARYSYLVVSLAETHYGDPVG